jgi:hypothetical protein
MQENKSTVKIVILIVLILTLLPLALFILIQFAPPREAGTSIEAAPSDETTASKRSAATEHRAARQEVKTTHTANVPHGMASDPDMMENDSPNDVSVVGAGAVVPNAPRGKRATPYPPGEVPGDSGVIVQYAGSPDDMMSGPQPPPQDDLWGGRTPTPISPANMRGIGGVRRVDPNDPFFQQDIPNPFNR